MKKLLLMTLLLGAAFATQAQHRGHHQPPPRHGHDRYDRYDDCDNDRRGRGHYKHVRYRDRRDYRECRDEHVVVVRRPGIPLPPPPPIIVPRPPRITGVVVIR